MDTLMEIARVIGPALTSLIGAYVAIKYRLARVEESLTELKSDVKELTEKHTELGSDISDMKVQNAEDHGEVKQQVATLHTHSEPTTPQGNLSAFFLSCLRGSVLGLL